MSDEVKYRWFTDYHDGDDPEYSILYRVCGDDVHDLDSANEWCRDHIHSPNWVMRQYREITESEARKLFPEAFK